MSFKSFDTNLDHVRVVVFELQQNHDFTPLKIIKALPAYKDVKFFQKKKFTVFLCQFVSCKSYKLGV